MEIMNQCRIKSPNLWGECFVRESKILVDKIDAEKNSKKLAHFDNKILNCENEYKTKVRKQQSRLDKKNK